MTQNMRSSCYSYSSFKTKVLITIRKCADIIEDSFILHVSNSLSVHHQEFFTVHTAMVFVIAVFKVKNS